MRVFRAILLKKPFLPLFGSMALGAFNDNCFRQAMIAALAFGSLAFTGETMSAETKSLLGGLAMSLLILPFFLFSSLAGELADRYSKATLIKLAKGFELIVMAGAGYCFYQGLIVPLFIALFLMGSQSAFFGPLKYGLLPEILTKGELLAGNALISGGSFLAITLGSLTGASLAAQSVGPGLAPEVGLALPITLALISLIGFGFALAQPASTPADPTLKINPKLWGSTYDIVKSTRARKDIWVPILLISWFWAMGSVVLTQLPVLASEVLGATVGVNAFLTTMFSVGVALGSLLAQSFCRGRVSANLAPLAGAFLTIFMTGLAFSVLGAPEAVKDSVTLSHFLSSWPYLRFALLCFLVSVSGGLFVVPLIALIQRLARPEEKARVIAANNIANSLFIVLGNLLVMGLIQLIGASIPQVFLVVALSALVVSLLAFKAIPQGPILAAAGAIIQLIYRPKIEGLENLEGEETLIIIPNHVSFLDVALLSCFSPRSLVYAIDANWRKVWWVRLLVQFFPTIPVNPASPMSVRDLINVVGTDKTLVIFPEGRITSTGSIMKIHEGAGLIATKREVKVVPVFFSGLENTLFGRLRKYLRVKPPKTPIAMTIFPPRELNLPRAVGEKGRDYRRRLSLAIYDILIEAGFKSLDNQQNLWTALNDAARYYGKKRVIIEDFQRSPLTYAQFLTKARVLGRFLAHQTSPGEKVGVLAPNSIGLGLILFGLWAGGRIPVVLNYSQGPRHLVSAVNTSQIKTIITSEVFLKTLGDKLDVKNLNVKTIALNESTLKLKDIILGLFWRGQPAAPQSPAVVIFTTGTEGQPKGVVLSHANLMANIHEAVSLVEVNVNDILFNAMPCFHVFGLNIGLVLPLIRGLRSFIYLSPLHIKAIPELIYDTRASILIGSDTFAAAWAKNAHPYDFRYVTYVLLGAEKIQPKTRELYFNTFGIRLYEGYGITESAPVVAINTPMRSKIGSVGQFCPGMEYRLEPVPGIELGGRLWIKGPNVMLGYMMADNPGQIKPVEDGWHDTGDLVEVDSEGYVFIKGRLKRFAKIKGEMVSLALIEEIALTAYPEEKTVALSLGGGDKGETLHLVTTNPELNLDALRAKVLASGLTELSCPRKLMVVKEIPVTPIGKIDLQKLIAMATSQLAEREKLQ
ncbi:MAG: MFS transporter [Deltaproteobacteria bacterium]|jgi:acyl-[acyl-carrier-protein]-phospholipid O-acyltransferase/long-chain-fatty-acid--[acyl-carrier-protein] ligase|nr:MFS transporter [Deltaproteobacteria bacterium]